MTRHLEDHELAAALAGEELARDAEEHFENCLSCRRELEGLRGLLCERRAEIQASEPDWEQQRQAVMARLHGAPATARRRPRWLRPVLAAAAALVVAVGLRSMWMSPEAPELPIENDLQIEQILAEVDAVLDDESLPGFEAIDPGLDDPEGLFENGAS